MRCRTIFVCLLALAGVAAVQASSEQASPVPANDGKASLQGGVVKDPGGEHIKKAVVELIAENQEEDGNYTATSGPEGLFQVTGIEPGRYRIFVERPGFLEVDAKHKRSQGMSLSFGVGQEVKDVVLRMQPAAVITGRVLDEDGDPMPGAEVTASQRRYSAGRLRLEPAGGAQTNDLGEFRIGGVPAGTYYLTANPPVNFQSILAEKKSETPGSRASEMSYVATFYPGTTDRSQAGTVELHPGDETPVNFSLVRIRAAHVCGSVAGLAAGSKAIVLLRSSESSAMFSAGEVDKDGKFDIPRVAPGRYTVIVSTVIADTPQSARSTLEVSDSDVEGLRLSLSGGTLIRGHVRTEPKADLKSMVLYVALRRLDGEDEWSDEVTFSNESGGSPAKVKADGSFELKEVPAGRYEVEVSSAAKGGGDYLVESAAVGTKGTVDSGLNVNGGTLSLEVTLSASAGIAEGSVVNEKKEPVANAVVVAVPEAKYQKRISRYYRGSADQNGHFMIRGIRPGNYTLYAWEGLEGDDYLDPEFLKHCEGGGIPIKVQKGSRQSAALKVIPDLPEQP
jgi:hypothetical protein